MLAISTAAVDPASLMWRLLEQGREGDPAFYLREYAAPPGCGLDDEDAWAVANPALHDFLHVDALRANLKTLRESSFRRYRLNQWVQDDAAWLPAAAWNACKDERPIPGGAEVVLGFDGSYNGDNTVIVAVQRGGVPHVDLVQAWQRPDTTADWSVPILQVEDAIRAACKRWRVRSIVADPFRWARSLELLAAEGLPVEVFPQTAARMSPATTRFYEAVMNATLTHSGDSTLARHMYNAVVKEDARGVRLAKPTRSSKDYSRPIDAAVAAVMAYSVAATVTTGPQIFVFEDEDDAA